MLFFDLRGVLFGLLLLLSAVVALVVWLERRRRAWSGFGETQALLERVPFGVLALQGGRTCRFANPYARRLLGLKSPLGRLPKADWVGLLDQDRLAARHDLAATGCYRNFALSSEQFVRWWVTAWADQDLVCLWDITTQQRAEQAARSILGDLSHELRTPLATILTHLEVLRLPDLSDDARRQSIHLMQIEARRMSRMANNLLELSRLESSGDLERRPVDLVALAEETLAQLAPRAQERGIAISLQAEASLPLAVGDPGRLKQVLLNLLDNAIKYSRPGDRALVSLRREGQHVTCAVRDTGPGIPPEHLPHVTRRFYRGVPEGGEGGSGLGLALVEEILRRHQSRLEIESHTEGDERGTCARFVLSELRGEAGS
jgi:signal transduction histidine kinase